MRYHERMVMLSVLDSQWKDHLLDMDHLKEGIGLRGYGQHDPLVEYKRESFDMFEAMMPRFQEDTVRYLYLMQILERPAESGSEVGLLPAAATTAMAVARRETWLLQLTNSKNPSSARNAVNWIRRAWPDRETPAGSTGGARRREGWPQRPLPLRLRKKIQEVLRSPRLICNPGD